MRGLPRARHPSDHGVPSGFREILQRMLTAVLIALCYIAIIALAWALCWHAEDADPGVEQRPRIFG